VLTGASAACGGATGMRGKVREALQYEDDKVIDWKM